jgi:hypothetical protein
MDPEAQTAFDEREISNPELEKVLTDREVAKGKKGEAAKKFTTLDDLARGKLEELGVDEGERVRVGRFVVERRSVKARSVAFDTEPTTRLNIKVDEAAE